LKKIQNCNLAVVFYGCETWSLALKEEQSWKMRWVGHVTHKDERGGVYRILIGKLEGTGLL
jgi:hypothetical protein